MRGEQGVGVTNDDVDGGVEPDETTRSPSRLMTFCELEPRRT
jgi:hypothetical protein